MVKGWKKKNDVTWESTKTGALVQVVPTRTSGFKDKSKNGKRIYDVYVESRNKPKHRRVRIPNIKKKSIAQNNAMKWMRRHPKG